ncbi:MAG: hypothetical protein WAT19_04915 [Ferruginibacter sp.]
MQKIFFAAIFLFFSVAAQAQLNFKAETSYNPSRSFACNFFTTTDNYVPVSADNVSELTEMKWMNDIVEKIASVVGLQNKFKLYSFPNSNNCSAVCLENEVGSDRYIIFDRLFLQRFEKTTNRWFITGVVAHELGHHFNGHTLSGYGSRPDNELEADAFAGYIMQKLGANKQEAKSIFSFLKPNQGPPSHPFRAQRYEAVERGWNEAANKRGLANLSFNEADDGQMAERVFFEAQVQTNNAKKLELLQKAQRLYPKHASINSELGLAYLNANQPAMADVYTQISVKQAPYTGWIWLNRAKYFNVTKALQEQYNCLDSALKYKPVLPEAYLMRAAILEEVKEYNLALQNISIGLAMGPEPQLAARLYLQKASALKALGKKAEAKESYLTAKRIDPFNPLISLLESSYE